MSQKETNGMYSIPEIITNKGRVFAGKKYSNELIETALKLSGNALFSTDDAVRIVTAFLGSDTVARKDENGKVIVADEMFDVDSIVRASKALFADKKYTQSLVHAALIQCGKKQLTRKEAIDVIDKFASRKVG